MTPRWHSSLVQIAAAVGSWLLDGPVDAVSRAVVALRR